MKIMKNQIDGEQTYPIYVVNARWIEDGKQDPNYPKWYEGLPEGRIYNGTGFSFMCKEEMTEEEQQKYVNDWWNKYIKNKEKPDKNRYNHIIKNPELIKLEIKLKEFEVWCLSWFEHYTFDIGQSDEEALKSFEKFVERKEELNFKNNEDADSGLMGAIDRWRWRGRGLDGKSEGPAPCRCKFCKEQGVLKIGH